MPRRSPGPASLVLVALAAFGCNGSLTSTPTSCAPSNAPFTPPEFVPAPQSTGACSTADIGNFIAACGVAARGAILVGGADTCTPWLAKNLGGTCGACLVNANNNGAVLVNVSGLYPISNWTDAWIGTNSFACTQLLTGDSACPASGISLDDCENAACNLACGYPEYNTIEGAFPDCANASIESGGPCAGISAAASANCRELVDDAGALDLPTSCYPEGGVNASVVAGDSNLAYIANLICGPPLLGNGGPASETAMDAGSPP